MDSRSCGCCGSNHVHTFIHRRMLIFLSFRPLSHALCKTSRSTGSQSSKSAMYSGETQAVDKCNKGNLRVFWMPLANPFHSLHKLRSRVLHRLMKGLTVQVEFLNMSGDSWNHGSFPRFPNLSTGWFQPCCNRWTWRAFQGWIMLIKAGYMGLPVRGLLQGQRSQHEHAPPFPSSSGFGRDR